METRDNNKIEEKELGNNGESRKDIRKAAKKEKKRKRGKFKSFLLFIRNCLMVLMVLVIAAGAVVYNKVKPLVDSAKETAYEKLVSMDDTTFMRLEDTLIFDSNNEKIGEINISNFQYAEINNISKFIQDGYIAVEDQNFMTHGGIDYKAILRAGIALVKNKGEITQGGSTITQQVLKNNVIGTEMDKWDRKLLEVFLAPEFEKMFSKADIMEFYCNSNFYGNNCYGVETTSQYYFGKSAKDVTLGEAALIVGISNSPSKYNPIKHPKEALERRHLVLTRMLEEQKITQSQFNSADKEELNLVLAKDNRTKETYQVSYALHCAALKLMEKDDFAFKYTFTTEEEYNDYQEEYNETYSLMVDKVRNGGYKIYTSLDTSKQNKLQEVVDNTLKGYKEQAEDGRYTMQGAATLVDNSNGYVVAIVGGRGTEDEYNRGYQALRQPGSSIKPIVVYAPAFETGKYYPSLKIKDEKIKDGPNNAGNSFRGDTSIREAIARSTNTIAYKVLQEIKPSTGVSYLGQMRFSGLDYSDTYNGSMALGGFTYGTTTVEMAKAYSTLVAGGTYSDNTCIKKMEFQDGSLVHDGKVNYTQVFTPDTAYMTLDCLKGVIEEPFGTGRAMAVKDTVIAGKTGTTNSNKDGWFCGVSEYYSLSAWCGYDQPRAIPEMGGGKFPGQIFKSMMTYLHEDLEELEFVRPETIFEDNVNWKGLQVDYNSGTKDLFSQLAVDKINETQRLKEEAERKEAEEREKKLELEKVERVRGDVENFSSYEVYKLDDIYKLDKKYTDLKEQVNSVKDSEIKSSLLAELESYYTKINSIETVKNFREEIEIQERLEKEAEEKRLAEEEARLAEEKLRLEQEKLNKIQVAETALSKLEAWIGDEATAMEALRNAESAVLACSEYEGYNELAFRLELQRGLINDYFNPVAPIEIEENTGNLESETEELGGLEDSGDLGDNTEDKTGNTNNLDRGTVSDISPAA